MYSKCERVLCDAGRLLVLISTCERTGVKIHRNTLSSRLILTGVLSRESVLRAERRARPPRLWDLSYFRFNNSKALRSHLNSWRWRENAATRGVKGRYGPELLRLVHRFLSGPFLNELII